MFAARANHVSHTIKPALMKRQWVICDRFTDSTYAYQGAATALRAKPSVAWKRWCWAISVPI